MKLSERAVTKQVTDFLEYRGWRAIRMQSALVKGELHTFRVGEVGIPDYLFLHYLEGKGVSLALWIEFKQPRDRDRCSCKIGSKLCRYCGQFNWRAREKLRGATVWKVKQFEPFELAYREAYGWIHGPQGIGQMTL